MVRSVPRVRRPSNILKSHPVIQVARTRMSVLASFHLATMASSTRMTQL